MTRASSTEPLLCALLYLLTRHARSPSGAVSSAIREHLQSLAEQSGEQDPLALASRRVRLTRHWERDARREIKLTRAPSKSVRPSRLH